MAVGIESAGVDLDSILAAYTAGRTKAAATGIRTGSGLVDLNQRYENIIYGTGPAATEIKTNGADLNTIFCSIASDWTATLPKFPNAFTTSPQTGSMTVTLTGGPGGTYTYAWSATSSGGAYFTINSGQGTATINWTATGTSGEYGIITVTCLVTATSGANVSAQTTMHFNIL